MASCCWRSSRCSSPSAPYSAPRFFTLLEGLAMLGALIAAIRWRALLGDGVLLLALIPLLFAFRSLPNYFGIAPWIALYAANMAYRARLDAGVVTVRRRVATRTGRMGRQPLPGAYHTR